MPRENNSAFNVSHAYFMLCGYVVNEIKHKRKMTAPKTVTMEDIPDPTNWPVLGKNYIVCRIQQEVPNSRLYLERMGETPTEIVVDSHWLGPGIFQMYHRVLPSYPKITADSKWDLEISTTKPQQIPSCEIIVQKWHQVKLQQSLEKIATDPELFPYTDYCNLREINAFGQKSVRLQIPIIASTKGIVAMSDYLEYSLIKNI